MASNAKLAMRLDLLSGLVRDGGGGEELHPALDVLRLVVVEVVFLDDDLTGNGDLGVLVAEDGDLDLPGVDALLDDDAPVEPGAPPRRWHRLAPRVLRLADADARAEVRGLDEAGYPREVFDLLVQAFLSFSHCLRVRAAHATCGRPWWAKIFFMVGLSMPAALPSTPLPT